MSETIVLETHYKIHYTTQSPVSIEYVIDSLRALERLLKRTGPFIEEAFEGIRVLDTEVYISEIQSGSLINDFVVKHICGGEKNLKDLKKVGANIMADSDVVKTVVSVGVGALIAYGVMQTLPSGTPTKNTEAYQSVVLEAGGDINLTGESIKDILEGIRDKKSLARESIDAIRPAKGDNSSIRMDGYDKLTIPSEMVTEAPEEYQPPQAEERVEKYKNAKVLIFASDRDNNERGWAGIVVGVAEKRTKITLADSLNPVELHGKTQVRANVTVTSKFMKSKKEYEPKEIEITAFH